MIVSDSIWAFVWQTPLNRKFWRQSILVEQVICKLWKMTWRNNCITILNWKNLHKILCYFRFNEKDPDFFSEEVRTLVIDFILNKINWGREKDNLSTVGFQSLIDKGVYKAAYALHDVSVLLHIFFYRKCFNRSKWLHFRFDAKRTTLVVFLLFTYLFIMYTTAIASNRNRHLSKSFMQLHSRYFT